MTPKEFIDLLKNIRVVVKFEYVGDVDPEDPPDEEVYFIVMRTGQRAKIHPVPNIEVAEIGFLHGNDRAQLFEWVDTNGDKWVPGTSKGIKYGEIVFGAIHGYVRLNLDKMVVEVA